MDEGKIENKAMNVAVCPSLQEALGEADNKHQDIPRNLESLETSPQLPISLPCYDVLSLFYYWKKIMERCKTTQKFLGKTLAGRCILSRNWWPMAITNLTEVPV